MLAPVYTLEAEDMNFTIDVGRRKCQFGVKLVSKVNLSFL